MTQVTRCARSHNVAASKGDSRGSADPRGEVSAMSRSEALGEQREVELPQGTIRYRERGSGEPIVFVHGVLVNGDLWRGVAPLLADRGYRCIVPDLPLGAHELAMHEDADLTPPGLARLVADFIGALGLDAPVIVANDTGGALTQIA